MSGAAAALRSLALPPPDLWGVHVVHGPGPRGLQGPVPLPNRTAAASPGAADNSAASDRPHRPLDRHQIDPRSVSARPRGGHLGRRRGGRSRNFHSLSWGVARGPARSQQERGSSLLRIGRSGPGFGRKLVPRAHHIGVLAKPGAGDSNSRPNPSTERPCRKDITRSGLRAASVAPPHVGALMALER